MNRRTFVSSVMLSVLWCLIAIPVYVRIQIYRTQEQKQVVRSNAVKTSKEPNQGQFNHELNSTQETSSKYDEKGMSTSYRSGKEDSKKSSSRTEEMIKPSSWRSPDETSLVPKRQSGLILLNKNHTSEPIAPAGDAILQYVLGAFRKPITSSEKLSMLRILRNVDAAFRRNNIDYCLFSGTLLGSYRHHGFIPWDDDLDILVNIDSKLKLQRAMLSLPNDFILWTSFGPRWKIMLNSSTPIHPYPWSWPFLDIILYSENKTHIWEQDSGYPSKYKKTIIFPFTLRPFEGALYPVPRNPKAVLKLLYHDLDFCATLKYSHRNEVGVSQNIKGVPCKLLNGIFPFVKREYQRSGEKEVLVVGEKIVGPEWIFPFH